jgi:hypothetical protein
LILIYVLREDFFIMSSLIVLSVLINTIHVHSESLTTSTTPPNQIHFVPSSNTRGTLDILWSCFFTIIACTWTIQHLNIPEQRNARDPGWTGDLKWIIMSLWRDVKWMLATMIAPEYILGKALADLYAAVRSMREMGEYARADGVEWELTHGFFANMGGFVLSQRGVERLDDKEAVIEGEDTGTRGTVRKELEKGAVKRADIEATSGTLDRLEASKERASLTTFQRERRDGFEDGHKNTELAGSSTTAAHEAIAGHDPDHPLPRRDVKGMERKFGKHAHPSNPVNILQPPLHKLILSLQLNGRIPCLSTSSHLRSSLYEGRGT